MPMPSPTHGRVASLALAAATPLAAADPPPRDVAPFSIVQTTAPGDSVFLVGDLPELGAGDLARAIKLEPSGYPAWSVSVSLPVNRAFEYQFVVRDDGPALVGDPTNGTPVTPATPGQTASVELTPPAKTVIVQGFFDQPTLWFRQPPGAGDFEPVEMWDIGPGRSTTERRWVAEGFGVAGVDAEFYVIDRLDTTRANATHTARLDRVLLRDGQLFVYEPAPTVSPPRRDYDPADAPYIYSTALGENRRYRVYLPRGYDEHTTRRYPVIYMHDGQNLFEMGTFGTWDVDGAADRLVREGAMRECVIVGVDSNSNRIRDYITPDDIVPFGAGAGSPGRADAYARFLIDELKPIIDATYRTLPDADHTAAIGSSLGAVVSLYLGWDHNASFRRVGAMSGSWWLPNFPARVDAEPWRDLRVYLDVGNAGASNDGFDGSVAVRDSLVRKGASIEGDLRFRVGVGDEHTEAAWARRLPWGLEFLFPAREATGGLDHIVTARRADVNGDGLENLDDLYALDDATGPNDDVDRDGVGATPADRAALLRILRRGEHDDVTATRAPHDAAAPR
jgi:predicted alpha/beta superfamily hydrolase